MARQRYINTSFWQDEYIESLDPLERYLFIYYLTNPLCNIAGIYKIGVKRIAFETGLEQDIVIKLTKRFEKSYKIIYKNGWIAIKNFIKHQAINPNIKKGIDTELANAPKELIDWINKPFKSLSKPLNYINVNVNDNDNDNVNDNDNKNVTEMLPNKNINKNNKFIIPSYKQIEQYCNENNYVIDIQHFIDYNTARGWTVGKYKMKDWKATIRTWVRNNKKWKEEKEKRPICEKCGKEFVKTREGLKCPICL